MDHDQQFLSFIHKNAAMGVSAIPQVLSLPQSRAMGQALNSQLQEYRTIAAQSQAYARKHGARLHTPGLAVRAMSGAMLKARTAADRPGAAQKAGGRWLGPPLPLVKNLPQRGPQRVLSSVEDRIKSKSIISRDMLLENDTSHDR